VVAVVVRRAGSALSANDLTAYAGQRLAGYKKPRRVEFVDSLPISAYGKVLKRELRARLVTATPSS